MRVYNSGNSVQSIANNSLQQIGFDDQSYNTYQGLGQSKYSLKFSAFSGFAFSNTILPASGMYGFEAEVTLNTTSASTECAGILFLYNSGNVLTAKASQQFGGSGFDIVSFSLADKWPCNAGDIISVYLLQINSGSASLPLQASGGVNNTFLCIRYLGSG